MSDAATAARPQEGSSSDRDVAAEEAGRAAVAKAQRGDGEPLTRAEEGAALDFLLGSPKPAVYKVPVTLDTDNGPARLTFVIRSLDSRKIDSIEMKHQNEATGRLDKISADLELVVTATDHLTDVSGRKVTLGSDEFLTLRGVKPDGSETQVKMASPIEAMESRFKTQLGLISGVATELRRVSGWDAALVGKAQRSLVDAAGN